MQMFESVSGYNYYYYYFSIICVFHAIYTNKNIRNAKRKIIQKILQEEKRKKLYKYR